MRLMVNNMKQVILRRIIISSFVFFAAFVLWIGYEIFQLPMLPDKLTDLDLSSSTAIFDVNDRKIDEMGKRTLVPTSQISQHFLNSVLVIEDHRFYEHRGVDRISFTRAVFNTIRSFSFSHPGGSTITQQLAKHMFLPFKKTARRKIQDILLALQFEVKYTKAEILEAYANQVNFGNGAFGIENASLFYFGKRAAELNLAEGSLLAAVVQRPSVNLLTKLEVHQRRQRIILNKLLSFAIIDQRDYDDALNYEYTWKNLLTLDSSASHFIRMVKEQVADLYGSELLYYGGLKIYTTLDADIQQSAHEAMQEGLTELDTRLGTTDYLLAKTTERALYPQGALVSVDPKTGAIRAMVGGRETRADFFNRAIEARRSPGSSFKPILYLAYLKEMNITAELLRNDSLITYPIEGSSDWTPQNFDKTYAGPVILKYALMKSLNSIAAQMIHEIGAEKVVEMAKTLGVESELQPMLALALGSEGISVREMATVYATIANGGVKNDSYSIRRIEDYAGNILFDEHIPEPERVIDPTLAYLGLDLMQGVLQEGGTGRSVRQRGFLLPAGGKTGTTNDYKDSWFAGITPDLVTVAWVGYDDFTKPLIDKNRVGITGSTGALPVWTIYMNKIENRLSGKEFEIPNTITFKYFDPFTGIEVNENTQNAIKVAVKR